ncbi:MAG TPA: ribonuclease III [Nitrospira sp.]|nr:ribonuclease III [Nitrospira sp.]
MTSAGPADSLQPALGYRFTRPALLDEALTHKSYVNEQRKGSAVHNERQEFLGDAVLSLLVSEQLANSLPGSSEGALSKLKARLVSEQVLCAVARRLQLGQWLRLGRGEEQSKGREKDSLLADTLEAVIAAVYLDGGLEAGRAVVAKLFEPEFTSVLNRQHVPGADDYKTQFQEWCQKRYDVLPEYAVVRESGPDHDKQFDVEVTLNRELAGRGSGKTKKEAEQAAAKEALKRKMP